MITNGKILEHAGNRLVIECADDLEREIAQKNVQYVEIRLDDGRRISAEQRKKVFAMIRDIAFWNGDEPEYIRKLLTWDFCSLMEIPLFSLSSVDLSTARDFITYLINFCFTWNVPTRCSLVDGTDDMGRYLYLCLEHRKCAICNSKAEVHHVDKVGMGRNRDEILHEGMRAIALCHKHHTEAHNDESKLFEKYHVYGIKLDKYLCNCLNLNADDRGVILKSE